MSTPENNVPAIMSSGYINYLDPAQFATAQKAAMLWTAAHNVPKDYQGDNKSAIASCVVAMDIAMRMKISPLLVMQNLVIVQGRPTWSATFLAATINTCGRFSPLRFDEGTNGQKTVEYELWEKENGKSTKRAGTLEIEDLTCVAWCYEKATGERLESIPISIEMAVKEGWYTKNGSKWKTMTRQMLRYRAIAFFARIYSPEICMGMLTPEEVHDMVLSEEGAYMLAPKGKEKEIGEQNYSENLFDDMVKDRGLSEQDSLALERYLGAVAKSMRKSIPETKAAVIGDGDDGFERFFTAFSSAMAKKNGNGVNGRVAKEQEPESAKLSPQPSGNGGAAAASPANGSASASKHQTSANQSDAGGKLPRIQPDASAGQRLREFISLQEYPDPEGFTAYALELARQAKLDLQTIPIPIMDDMLDSHASMNRMEGSSGRVLCMYPPRCGNEPGGEKFDMAYCDTDCRFRKSPPKGCSWACMS